MQKIQSLFGALLVCTLLLTGCSKEEFTVTFHANGGKGGLITQVFSQKVAQPLMVNSFTNWGHTFIGWDTSPDGNGTKYTDQETVIISRHLVLYAQWEPVSGEFTVTFDSNGGIGSMSPQIFEAGNAQPLSPNKFHYENYLFVGWNTLPNGNGRDFTNGQVVTLSSNITLFAQWKLKSETFFVIFYSNGGVGTMDPQAFNPNESQRLDSNSFVREGYYFSYWNTKADGEGYVYNDAEEIRIFNNMVLYAQWDSIPVR